MRALPYLLIGLIALALAPQLARTALINAAGVAVLRTAGNAPGEDETEVLSTTARLLGLARAISPSSSTIETLAAEVAQRRGETNLAVQHLERAWELAPLDRVIGWQLGLEYLQVGRDDDAVRTWRAINAGPMILQEAQGALEEGRLDDAISEYRLAQLVEPAAPAAYLGQASAYERSGRLDEAIAIYRRLIDRSPSLASAYLGLVSLLARTASSDEVIREPLLECEAQADEPGGCLFQVGVRELRAGHPDEAVFWLSRAVVSIPSSGDSWSELGQAYAQQGRCGEAIQMFRQAQQLGNHSVWRWMSPWQVGQIYRRMGEPPEALAAFEEARRAAQIHEAPANYAAEIQKDLDQARLSSNGDDPARAEALCQS